MLWIVAFHVIFVICWFAGLFYLPRLFVYHAMTADETSNQRFKIMERKLFWGIMIPSSILSLISGLWLLYGYALPQYEHAWWLHGKLICVIFLFIYQAYCWKYLRDFKKDRNTHSHVFYRWFNEAPTILLVLIVIFAIVKPF